MVDPAPSLPPSIGSVQLPSDVESAPTWDVTLGIAKSSATSDLSQIDLPDGVETRSSCSSDDDDFLTPNAFDDIFDPDDEMNVGLEEIPDAETMIEQAVKKVKPLHRGQHIAEYYSPPRVTPVAAGRGMLAELSTDLETGWDFRLPSMRALGNQLLTILMIHFLILSPPCTVFSELQRLWNIKRISQCEWAKKWDEGMLSLDHCMQCAKIQIQNGNFFAFEHPSRASSWKQDTVQEVRNLPGVWVQDFDMCMLGLTSPVLNMPMRKRTRVMTNSRVLAALLGNKFCDRKHEHQLIQGQEGGISRAKWAQKYPAGLVNIFVEAASAELKCHECM